MYSSPPNPHILLPYLLFSTLLPSYLPLFHPPPSRSLTFQTTRALVPKSPPPPFLNPSFPLPSRALSLPTLPDTHASCESNSPPPLLPTQTRAWGTLAEDFRRADDGGECQVELTIKKLTRQAVATRPCDDSVSCSPIAVALYAHAGAVPCLKYIALSQKRLLRCRGAVRMRRRGCAVSDGRRRWGRRGLRDGVLDLSLVEERGSESEIVSGRGGEYGGRGGVAFGMRGGEVGGGATQGAG